MPVPAVHKYNKLPCFFMKITHGTAADCTKLMAPASESL